MSLHIAARTGEIAEAVLLPGDPLRAQSIAEVFLEDAVCYSRIRGMLGFTGTWRGKRVSVQGTGMGMPSASIYIHELLQDYGVKTLIRVGTAGSIREELPLRALLMATGACTDSALNHYRFKEKNYACIPDFELAIKAWNAAKEKHIPLYTGNILSTDLFYQDSLREEMKHWADYGVWAAEMETAELYTLAARHQAKALTLLTISDHILKGESTPAMERQKDFRDMTELALEIL